MPLPRSRRPADSSVCFPISRVLLPIRMDIYPLGYTGLQMKECQLTPSRQATEEPLQEVPRCRQDQGPQEEQELNVTHPRLSRRLDGDGDGRFAHSGYSNSNGYKSSRWLWTCSRTRTRTRRWGELLLRLLLITSKIHNTIPTSTFLLLDVTWLFDFVSFSQTKRYRVLVFRGVLFVLLPYGK